MDKPHVSGETFPAIIRRITTTDEGRVQILIDAGLGEQWGGMTLRDFFAAKALQGYFVVAPHRVDADDVAKYCYAMADAMLKAREASMTDS